MQRPAAFHPPVLTGVLRRDPEAMYYMAGATLAALSMTLFGPAAGFAVAAATLCGREIINGIGNHLLARRYRRETRAPEPLAIPHVRPGLIIIVAPVLVHGPYGQPVPGYAIRVLRREQARPVLQRSYPMPVPMAA
jgi:hypothetical protein